MQVGNLEREGCAGSRTILASILVVAYSQGLRTNLILYRVISSSWRQILRHDGCDTSSIDTDVSRLVVEMDVDSEAVRLLS
jgi:hypothetical protein